MRVLLSVLAVPVLFFGWQHWSERSLERRLEPVVSEIAGRPTQVDCQSFWGELIDVQSREGEVRFDASGVPEAKIFLTRATCSTLKDFAGSERHSELDCLAALDWSAPDALRFHSPCYEAASDTVFAVLVLAHEAWHVRGERDEAATNCFAIQSMAYAAHRLGAAPDEAELLARAMAALEPRLGAPYGTVDCRAGTWLDLHPETAAFPTEQPLAPPG